MRLAHHSDNGDLEGSLYYVLNRNFEAHTTGCPNWSRLEFWKENFLVFVWNGADDVHESRYTAEAKFLADSGSDFVEVDVLALLVRLDQLARNRRCHSQQQLCL